MENPEANNKNIIPNEIENENDFHNWIINESKKYDDYVGFYKNAQHKFLDLLLNKKNIGNSQINQFIIRKEIFKIAEKKDNPFCDFIEKLYEILINYEKKEHGISHDVEKEKVKKLEDELAKILNEYKTEVGNYKIMMKINPLIKKLEQFSYGEGELVPKIKELNNKFHISAENAINYQNLGNLRSALNTLVRDMKMDLESNTNMEDTEIKNELKKMFDEYLIR